MRSILVVLFVCVPFIAAAQQEGGNAERLGASVNSSASELLPIVSPDGKSLYFVRGGHAKNLGVRIREEDQDIWCSTLRSDNTWGEAVNLGSPINNEYPNALLGITADGTQAVVLGYYEDGELTARGFSLVTRTKNGWSDPVGMDIDGYEQLNKGGSVTGCLSGDGTILLISFYPTADEEDDDIYVSTHLYGNRWSQPKPLLGINTRRSEACPFLAADGLTLYFSADRQDGFGNADVYLSRRLDSTWQKWSTPENLGPSINTPRTEMYYTIPASGAYAYFASSQPPSGEGDIYRIPLPEKARPQPVVIVKGMIYDSKTKKPIEAHVEYQSLSSRLKVGEARSHPATGEYQIVLVRGTKYGFFARKDGYYPLSENLDLEALATYKEIARDLYLTPIEEDITVRLNNVFFDFNQFTLRDESIPELQRLIDLLRTHPSMTIQIQGHTDNVGTPSYNHVLSENRARAVRDYIHETGEITATRLSYRGFGFTRPVSANESEEGRQLNRRVEFKIVHK
ncbi:MAG: OmpA family protein [Ignavibacteriae bacterium]|nr:OmpA family protein [Ignavibacteriota bacterium]